jgi:hypothetical protein
MATGPRLGLAVAFGWAALWLVLAAAIAFRLYALGRLPGINGDEAWYGVLAERLGHGNPYGWRTPSGNPPAPFQLGLLALLVRLAPPSFALLRLPAVIASIAQGAVTFVVARRHFGRGAALLALLLTAALPTEIVYARFGWDPSHSGLVAIAATHVALAGRRPALAALAALVVLLVWVHPTNVFLAPFLGAILVFRHPERRLLLRRAAPLLGVLAAGLLVGALVAAVAGRGGAAGERGGAVLSRLVHPRAWWEFTVGFVRLLDGDTVFTYITGAGYGAARPAIDLVAALLRAATVVAGRRRLAGDPAKLGVVVGWAASVAAFFVFAGPDALRPHLERYAVCLMVPTILALAVLATSAWPARRATVVAGAVAALALLAFWRCYFVALEITGSTSHQTFWTGAVEPKRDAFEHIAAEAGPRGAHVVAESWWLLWPLRFLAADGPVEVEDRLPTRADGDGRDWYFVDFPGGATARAAAEQGAAPRWQIRGAGERPVIEVRKLGVDR